MAKRLALITGGMGGLGATITTKMVEAGYEVVVTASPQNKQTEAWLADMGRAAAGPRRPRRRRRLRLLRTVRRAGAGRVGPDRHPGQQRGHHPGPYVQEDDKGRLGCRHPHEPGLGVQHDEAGVRQHDRARLGAHRQRVVGQRPEGRLRTDQLFRGQGRDARVHESAGAGAGDQGRDGQHDLARLHRDQDGDRHPQRRSSIRRFFPRFRCGGWERRKRSQG